MNLRCSQNSPAFFRPQHFPVSKIVHLPTRQGFRRRPNLTATANLIRTSLEQFDYYLREIVVTKVEVNEFTYLLRAESNAKVSLASRTMAASCKSKVVQVIRQKYHTGPVSLLIKHPDAGNVRSSKHLPVE